MTGRRWLLLAAICAAAIAGLVAMSGPAGDVPGSAPMRIRGSTLREIETDRLICAIAERGGRIEAMGCIAKEDDR